MVPCAPGGRKTSELRFRQPDDEAIEFIRYLDLASQATIRLAEHNPVEHTKFRDFGRGNPRQPLRINIAMAGAATARTAAIGQHAWHRVLDGSLHQRISG